MKSNKAGDSKSEAKMSKDEENKLQEMQKKKQSDTRTILKFCDYDVNSMIGQMSAMIENYESHQLKNLPTSPKAYKVKSLTSKDDDLPSISLLSQDVINLQKHHNNGYQFE